MSKPSLDSLLVKKGTAAPAVIDMPPPAAVAVPVAAAPALEPRKEETKEPSDQVSNEPSSEVTRRRRPWDGQDELIKVNYEVPRRVQSKLHSLKSWDRIDSLKAFVAEALEKACDREIAKAEKEGY